MSRMIGAIFKVTFAGDLIRELYPRVAVDKTIEKIMLEERHMIDNKGPAWRHTRVSSLLIWWSKHCFQSRKTVIISLMKQ
jgi:hypothetical protein